MARKPSIFEGEAFGVIAMGMSIRSMYYSVYCLRTSKRDGGEQLLVVENL